MGSDVEPLAGNRPSVDRLLRIQPLNEATGLVGVVAFGKVAVNFRQHSPWVII